MLQLSHINLHFDFKNSLRCIYLIINVIFILLENLFMNFKVFLLIFDISIFIKKYPPIYLRYIRYIHKMQVPIYPSKPIFSTLAGSLYFQHRLSVSDDKELKKKLLFEAHNTVFTMHPGGNKMYQDLKQFYWWKGMKRDVTEYVSKCLTCR